METLRNPLLASVPCGRVGGRPLRLGILTIFTLTATLFAFTPEPAPEPAGGAKPPAAATAEADAADAADAEPATPPAAKPDGGPPAVAASETPAAVSPERTQGFRLGFAVALVLLGSALLHEMAEAAVASRCGGEVAAIVLWPVGGRTVVTELDGAGWMQAALAGPAVHTVLCLLSLPAVVANGATDAFGLFSLPAVSFEGSLLGSLGLIIFSVNLKLLVANLLPVPPMDGSRLIRGWRLAGSDTGLEEPMTVGRWAMGGLFGGMAITGLGLTLSNAWVSAVGALVMACACTEVIAFMPSAQRPRPEEDLGVGGYDFSQGYTSLERDFAEDDFEEEPEPEPQLGFFARRRAEREAKQREQEARDRAAAERELDRLLAKVGEVGMAGLSAEEKAALTRLSERLKSGR